MHPDLLDGGEAELVDELVPDARERRLAAELADEARKQPRP